MLAALLERGEQSGSFFGGQRPYPAAVL